MRKMRAIRSAKLVKLCNKRRGRARDEVDKFVYLLSVTKSINLQSVNRKQSDHDTIVAGKVSGVIREPLQITSEVKKVSLSNLG